MNGYRAFVIAIANQKGGVAKTTSAVSLGGALVLKGMEVLLVDLDPQANLTLALGKDPVEARGAISDVFFNAATLASVSQQSPVMGLDFVPSNSSMELAERFLPIRMNYEALLRRAIIGQKAPLSEKSSLPRNKGVNRTLAAAQARTLPYDFLILDCPPSNGAVTLNALTAADMLIIPIQPEYFSAYSLRTMMNIIRQVRDLHNPRLAYRLLITMYDQRNRIHREVCHQIQISFGEGVLKTCIQIDTKLRESAAEGRPITHRKSQSRSAVQYLAVAQEIIEYVHRKQSLGK